VSSESSSKQNQLSCDRNRAADGWRVLARPDPVAVVRTTASGALRKLMLEVDGFRFCSHSCPWQPRLYLAQWGAKPTFRRTPSGRRQNAAVCTHNREPLVCCGNAQKNGREAAVRVSIELPVASTGTLSIGSGKTTLEQQNATAQAVAETSRSIE